MAEHVVCSVLLTVLECDYYLLPPLALTLKHTKELDINVTSQRTGGVRCRFIIEIELHNPGTQYGTRFITTRDYSNITI
jgi:HKD family nuclease